MDSSHSIFRSALHFFSGTMLSRVTGLFRDIAMAYAFGTQGILAAFFVAFRFAHLFRRLFGEGAMQTALIPCFEKLRSDSFRRASQFFYDLTLSLTVFLFFFIGFAMLGLWGLLFFEVLDSGNAEIAWLTFLMMPSLLFICLFGLNASILQCEKKYFISSSAPVVFNIFWILGIIWTTRLPDGKAMPILALFIVLACFAQWAVTLHRTYKSLHITSFKDLWKNAKWLSHDVKGLAKPLTLGIIGVAAAQINNALDSVFARLASAEGPALLWYAIRIQQLPLALFGIAISGAILPPLTRAIKANEPAKYCQFLIFALRRTVSLMLPITAFLFIMGDACIQIIYGRGDFGVDSVIGTTQALWGYILGLVPMALVLVFAPAFYADGNYKTPSLAALISMILNVALNAVFVSKWNMGPSSVAIATSISSWFNLFWLGFMLSKKEFVLPSLLLCARDATKVFLITSIASCFVFTIDIAIWKNSTALAILNNQSPVYLDSLVDQLIRFSFLGIIYGTVLFFFAWVFNAKDLTHFASNEA